MVKPICLHDPAKEQQDCTNQSLPPSLLLRASNPASNTEQTARALQENLSRLATSAGLPYQLSYGINLMRWGNLRYHTDSDHARAEATLIVPLAVEGGAAVSGTLDQVVTYKATINEDGTLDWEVAIGFQGTSELDPVAALLDSAGGMIDQTYFRNLIEAAHVDYALLAPSLWGRGEASPLTGNAIPTMDRINEQLARYSQDPDVVFGGSRQTATSARGLFTLLSLALTGDTFPSEGPTNLFLTRAASVLYRIPIRNDSALHDAHFWQQLTYGDVIYLEQLFAQAMKRFHIEPSSPLGKLYQRNIDHLRTVHRHMHYDDDFYDDDFDPELRGTAVAMQKVHGGPTPPDYTYDPGWIEEKIFGVVESGSGRRMKKFDFKPGWLEERAAELAAGTIDRATDKVIERTVPKIKAAIDEVIPKLDELKAKLVAYAADPRNRREIAAAVQKLAADLKPVVARFLKEVGKMSEAELKKRLPRLKAQLRELADLIEKEIYPNQIKPIVTELVEALSDIGRGSGSETATSGQAGPPSEDTGVPGPASNVPRSVGEWDRPPPK